MNYDEIGKTYNHTRMADDRITEKLITFLDQPLGSTIVDIGAGTGNYSVELAKRGYHVVAVEPSERMRGQAKQHPRLTWKAGVAEELPHENESADGIICTLATHHFRDLSLSFQEMARVLKKKAKMVIFTADPRLCLQHLWIADYFRQIVEQSCQSQPSIGEMVKLLEENVNRQVEVHPFPLPNDMEDKFFFSGWRTPDAYMDPVYRSGISSLAAAPGALLDQNLTRLSEDLSSGKWHHRYGNILQLSEYDCGYFFLVA